jgi:uncharacterized protein (UPF0261 family)
MTKKIVILGTLDTKGQEHLFLKQKIEEKGIKTIVVDTGIMDPPYFEPDITRYEVCNAVDYKVEDLVKRKDRKFAIDMVALGASEVVKGLYKERNLDAIISLGGGQGTYISTTAMRGLPFGVPKIMVSTTVSGDVSGYIGYKDITLMHSITDILGLNSFNKRVISHAASAICGMIEGDISQGKEEKPLIGVTMFGMTTPCVMKIKKLFERKNKTHDIVAFHARGSGGRAMEELIREGVIQGVIDITTTEMADELVGGIRSAGPHRLEAAGEMGIPQLVGPGALDMVNFGPMESVPKKFAGRKFYSHTPMVTVMRTNIAENIQLGEIIAEKMNKAKGKVVVAIPKKGFSTLDDEGRPFFDLDATLAFTQSLKRHLNGKVKVVEISCHINEDEYAEQVVNHFLQIL